MVDDTVNPADLNKLNLSSRSSIEQIREILFGEKAAEWERRMNTFLQGLRDLDTKLIETEKRLAEANLKISALTERYTQSDASWTQLHDLLKLLDKDLNHKIAQLQDAKTDRETVARAFEDWATRIRSLRTE